MDYLPAPFSGTHQLWHRSGQTITNLKAGKLLNLDSLGKICVMLTLSARRCYRISNYRWREDLILLRSPCRISKKLSLWRSLLFYEGKLLFICFPSHQFYENKKIAPRKYFIKYINGVVSPDNVLAQPCLRVTSLVLRVPLSPFKNGFKCYT